MKWDFEVDGLGDDQVVHLLIPKEIKTHEHRYSSQVNLEIDIAFPDAEYIDANEAIDVEETWC